MVVVTDQIADPAAKADRLIQGGGTSEAVWRAWLGSADLPCLSLNVFLPARTRLVVVAPHPDDEVLACGGLLALHAARRGISVIVGVTDGEASHRGSTTWNAQRLAAARREERCEGLSHLGIDATAVLQIGAPDGGVASHVEQIERALTVLLQPTDVVVTTWRLDGHPDHEGTARAVAQACASTGCPLLEAPVWMWHWASPGDPRVPWQRLRALPLPPDAIAAKQDALSAHVTQLKPRDTGDGPVLGEAILDRHKREHEYFFIRTDAHTP
jgi:LmbE family N-acetylglucosaminyl deacetylase